MSALAFRLSASGEDVTGTLADRLLSLSLTDEDGTRADRLEITLDDRDGRLAIPATGVELALSLGLGGRLVDMGRFVVDALSGARPPQTMTITATAADMTGPLRAPQSRDWHDVTLGDLVADIAALAGLEPACAPDLAGTFYPYVAQSAESALNLLTRLARPLDAIAKPAAGRLVVVPKGGATDARGAPIAPLALDARRLTDWRWQIEERAATGRIEAPWVDPATGARAIVTEGDGEPPVRLRHVLASEAEARRTARAELTRRRRAGFRLEVSLAGFEPAAFAGGRVTLSGLRPELDGAWYLTRVTHRLDGGLTTAMALEREAPS